MTVLVRPSSLGEPNNVGGELGDARGAMGTDAPSSPVKQRGLYTQMLLFEES